MSDPPRYTDDSVTSKYSIGDIVFEREIPYRKRIELIISDRTKFYHGKQKPVFHKKVSISKYRCSQVWSSGTTVVRDNTYSSYSADDYPKAIHTPPPTYLPDIDSLLDDVVSEMLGEFNLLNFIVEFGDIPELWARWNGLDDAVLRTNLGALPLWSEAVAIYSRIVDYSEKFENLRNTFKRGVRVMDSQVEDTVLPRQPYGSNPTELYESDQRLQRNWGAIVTGDFHNPVRSALQRGGVFIDLSVIWNALPMSFLIDYLLPIGNALARDRVYFNPSIRASWTSVKRSSVTRLYRLPFSIGGGPRPQDGDYYLTDTVVEESYERAPGLWDTFDGISTGGHDSSRSILALSPRQWSNVLALISSFSRS